MAGEPVEIQGAGRTDAGVHALGQVANAHLPASLSGAEITDYLNRYLPEDILVLETAPAPERFHSRLNVSGKIYAYWIDTAVKSPVFQRKYIYTLGQSLNIDAMRRAAALLIGTHDFKGFCSVRRMKKTTVRTVRRIDLIPHGSQIEIQMEGNGFLYNMVRITAGTLIEAGLGRRDPESISGILASGDRARAGFTAPPQGLFLVKVLYPEEALYMAE